MDFTYDDELIEVRNLARAVFGRQSTFDRAREAESAGGGCDARLWNDLAASGLLGVALPESFGGAGLGFGALCSVLIEQGAQLSPAPIWASVVAAMAVVEFGTDEQQARHVRGLVAGDSRIGLALEEFENFDCGAPRCVADRVDDRWVLNGTKAVVPAFTGADVVLVSAQTASGAALFLVESSAEGAQWESVTTTAREDSGILLLRNVDANILGTPRSSALDWILDRARVAVAALQLGVAERALELSADYVTSREQFGRPLGTFQAVAHQLADGYIGNDAMRVCLWRAVEDIDTDGGDRAASHIAKWWADDHGVKMVDTAVHVHGGVGVDTDSPVHRYYLWGHQLAGTLGGAEFELSFLGRQLAAHGPITRV